MILTGNSKYAAGQTGVGDALSLGSVQGAPPAKLSNKVCKNHSWSTRSKHNARCNRCGTEAVKDPITGLWKPWNS
jgi:hypothetical protein